MIVKANLNDVSGIMEIIGETIKEMKSYNNTQWDENYPKAEDFEKDIKSGCLYVDREDDIIRGFICVNSIEPVEYNDLNWSSNQECMVVHRMAVNSNMRNIGIGTKLMKFADELASSKGIKYLKTDTYSLNKKMNSLFKKCGYEFVGEMSFLGKEFAFYCYDKILND
ncbi:GNAT family N-acetyltransferase [Intestinibacter sp.]|uniref:GNAT family N-acetyltransferase n=1 Tax=Intestinibacter sp. TaxID=1965304 RepID=UPI003F187F18